MKRVSSWGKCIREGLESGSLEWSSWLKRVVNLMTSILGSSNLGYKQGIHVLEAESSGVSHLDIFSQLFISLYSLDYWKFFWKSSWDIHGSSRQYPVVKKLWCWEVQRNHSRQKEEKNDLELDAPWEKWCPVHKHHSGSILRLAQLSVGCVATGWSTLLGPG